MKGSTVQNISDYLSKVAIATASSILVLGLPFAVLNKPGSVQNEMSENQIDLSLKETQDNPFSKGLLWSAGNSLPKSYLDMGTNELEIDNPDKYESVPRYVQQKSVVIWCRMANATMGSPSLYDSKTTTLGNKDHKIVTKFFFVNRGDSCKPNQHINHIA